jgi:hypothetical protein
MDSLKQTWSTGLRDALRAAADMQHRTEQLVQLVSDNAAIHVFARSEPPGTRAEPAQDRAMSSKVNTG